MIVGTAGHIDHGKTTLHSQAAAAEPAVPGRWRRPLGGGAAGASGGVVTSA